MREFESWTDLNVIMYWGSKESREFIHNHEWRYFDAYGTPKTSIVKWNVMITTYPISPTLLPAPNHCAHARTHIPVGKQSWVRHG